MKFIHTSDWHLGKSLEGSSRMDEQELFLEDFIKITEETNVDMVIIAGDVFDSGNPPARAERMFYKAIKRISNNGNRLVFIIAGNHDSPERLEASNPLAYEDGIIIMGTPKSVVPKGKCGEFEILDSGEGYIEVDLKGQRSIITAVPYPSEKRLNEVLFNSIDEDERQKSYSERVGFLFEQLSKKYREDTINIAVSHLFTLGGEESDSERAIQLGGGLSVNGSDLPHKAQYVALGHLHKPQPIKSNETIINYSGAPLQYSKSEVGYDKRCYIVELKAGEKAKVDKIQFKNYKPIEIWKCKGVQEAIDKCKENTERECWVYMEIETEDYITQEEIKLMKSYKKDLLEIKPKIIGIDDENEEDFNFKEKSMKELFGSFFKKQKNAEVPEEIMELFLSIVEGEEN